MAEQLDLMKQYKDLYAPGPKPALVTVPPMRFMMVDGAGAPEDAPYQNAVGVLYAIAYTIKMSKMGGDTPPGYIDYKMPPLEGLWDSPPGASGGKPTQAELQATRSMWTWTSLLRQPDFVTEEVLAWAMERAKAKKPELDFAPLRLGVYDEGLCVQALHKGPYATEPETIAAMLAFMEESGCAEDYGSGRRHHEIYLGDPRRTKPENRRTILRLPVVEGF